MKALKSRSANSCFSCIGIVGSNSNWGSDSAGKQQHSESGSKGNSDSDCEGEGEGNDEAASQ